MDALRLGASFVDHALVVCFAVVLLIGFAAGAGSRTARTSSSRTVPAAVGDRGIAMVVFAGAFALWSRLRPVVVEEHPAGDDPAH